MKNNFSNWVKENEKIIINFLTLFTFAFIFQRSYQLIQTVSTDILDEGMYVVKGYFFAIGKYRPFQEYGPLTNHMPLSFLIPGYVQKWFGPGVRTERYFVFFLNILFYVGLWKTSDRLGGKWWGLISLVTWQLNPHWVEFIATGNSQILIVTLLTWCFYFISGIEQTRREVSIAAFLAGIIFLTRLNMIPILLIIPYIYWQYGKIYGKFSLISAITPIVMIHTIYFPKIFTLWNKFNPFNLLEKFNDDHLHAGIIETKVNAIPAIATFAAKYSPPFVALGEGIRINFLLFSTVLLVLISFFTLQKSELDQFKKKQIIFFSILFLILFSSHAFVGLIGLTCNSFCFSPYVIFFAPLSIFLLILIISNSQFIRQKKFMWLFMISITALLFIPDIFDPYIGKNFLLDGYLDLTSIEIPRFAGGRFLPGTAPIWAYLDHFFTTNQLATIVYPTIRFVEIILITVLFPTIVWKIYSKLNKQISHHALLNFSFATIVLLSPFAGFARNISLTKCETSIIDSYENFGKEISNIIPPNSLIYMGFKSSFIFSYLQDPDLFPPQMNTHFTYKSRKIFNDMESDNIFKQGSWNANLASLWQEEADYILIAGAQINDGWKTRIENGEFNILAISPPLEECREFETSIYVLEKTSLFVKP